MFDFENREVEIIARIENLEMNLRNTRRRLDRATSPADEKAVGRQMSELAATIDHLRAQLTSAHACVLC